MDRTNKFFNRRFPVSAAPGGLAAPKSAVALPLLCVLLACLAFTGPSACGKNKIGSPPVSTAGPAKGSPGGVFPDKLKETSITVPKTIMQPQKTEQLRTTGNRFAALDGLRLRTLRRNEARNLASTLNPARQGLRSWVEMRYALEQSQEFVMAKTPDANAVTLPTSPPTGITWEQLRLSLARMIELLPFLDDNPALLGDEFDWLAFTPEFGFTGYYEPTLNASYRPSPLNSFPIYGMPPELQKGLPYHDRHTIDRRGILKGRGLELAWVRDEMDVFFLQIQGSGRLVFPDGKVKHVLYAGKNGHPYVPLGAILRDKGLLDENNITMPNIRSCIGANPAQRGDLLDMNPSYVFFRLADMGPVGSINRPLTPLVSLAVDPKVLPHGSLLFFDIELPDQLGAHSRDTGFIGLPQDSGGAIKGRRVDFFQGAGKAAEHVAGHLNTASVVHILLAKPERSSTRNVATLQP